ncbi:hypothetical protein AB0K53_22900 [Streptomyces tuirus]|uniref:hypothetical protein n=1 Tax=Streptomyces tuirus TaxID=68278 RepID=UPI00344A725A
MAVVTGLIIASVSAGFSLLTAPDDPPEIVTYKVKYQNNTESQRDNVVVSVAIPPGAEYVMGSTYAATSKTNDRWTVTSDGITGRGLNMGSYAPGGAAYLKFQVRPRGKTIFTCASNGETGSVTVSAGDQLQIWVTC